MDTQENTQSSADRAIQDELRSIEGEFIAAGEASPGEAQAPPPEAPAMDWTIPAGFIVMALDRFACPNWQLEPGEKAMLHEQTVQTLQVFFPNVNLDPRWLALAALGGTVTTIAASRIDLETGKIKPMRAPRPDDQEATPEANDAS
jgi:hypothetical protein